MSFTASLEEIVASNGNGLLSIHPSWTRVRLREVAEILSGCPFDSNAFSVTDGFPLIRIRDVVRGSTQTFFTGEFEQQYVMQPGELLVGMDGDFNSARWAGPPALLNQRVCRITTDDERYDLGFLTYALPGYLKAINDHTPSITVKHLSTRTIAEIPLPLPPLPEQRRIVAKIEELFSDLDAGVAALERVRANLKRYRAAVLKAAVEGRLTEEWRKQHPATEPAATLLERILAERRAKWEQDQLRKFREAGKTPPKGWKEKYEEPPEPADLPADDLPERWTWATLLQLGSVDRGRSRHRPRDAAHLYGGPYPFVQTGDIGRANTFIRSYTQTYSEAGLAQSRLWPRGTLCITIAANIAETAILDIDACFPDSVVGFAPAVDGVSVRYVELYFRTVQKNLERWAPATAQKNINVETLAHLPVRLPPVAEQAEIVAEVDRRLSVADAAEQQVEHALQRAARLRQAILKRAFEGKLVPQDPSDEPAATLLHRTAASPSKPSAETRRVVRRARGKNVTA